MDKHKNKILYFLSALQDVYREPEEREVNAFLNWN
jgi:hypothetical protein